jgi:ATP-binding cassette, subfamily F, member 3
VLTLAGITKAFGGRTLFADVTLAMVHGDRVGLVGPNGAGKSTLFKLILGEEQPDMGGVTMLRGTTVGFLPQESAPVGDETVLEVATSFSKELCEVRAEMKVTRAAIETAGREGRDAHDAETHLHDLQARFDALGGHRLEAQAKKYLAGLAFREADFNRPARELSGGWIMRAHLARLLVQQPDLLMLDEPTNHLDLEALLWLQGHLKGYPGAILLISHDREFLNQLVTGIVEIRQSRIFRYTGNYDSFLTQREANEQQLIANWKSKEREIAHLQEFVDRFRAKNTKATQAQSKLKQIERIREEMGEAPQAAEKTIGFRFPQPQRSGQRVIKLENIHHAYGPVRVYEGMEFMAERGQRIVLVGPNGAGKSTLLKLLAAVITPQRGERTLGHNVKAGYYAQHRVEMLKPGRSVLEEALDTPQRVTEQAVRTVLGSFLFRGDDVFKPVSVLSGGEKSRLALVKLLLDPPNLLLMDEPTTHLDMSSIDALIEALRQYEGTLVFISHDVHFIRAMANHVVHVRAGRLTAYPGDYQYYLDKTGQAARAGLTSGDRTDTASTVTKAAPADTGVSRKEQRRQEAEQRQARARERRQLEQRVKELEAKIAALEAREVEIVAELEKPETYANGGRCMELNRELTHLHEDLPALHAEWEAAATGLQAFAGPLPEASVSP